MNRKENKNAGWLKNKSFNNIDYILLSLGLNVGMNFCLFSTQCKRLEVVFLLLLFLLLLLLLLFIFHGHLGKLGKV